MGRETPGAAQPQGEKSIALFLMARVSKEEVPPQVRIPVELATRTKERWLTALPKLGGQESPLFSVTPSHSRRDKEGFEYRSVPCSLTVPTVPFLPARVKSGLIDPCFSAEMGLPSSLTV